MFNQDIPDVEWLDRLGREGGWIIISADERISRNPAEKLVWRESHLTTFFFAQPWSGDKFWNQAKSLVTWWPEIVRQARTTPVDHGFAMPKSSKQFRKIYPV